MQCQQCQFENMPGLERCMRCGSVLGAPQTAIPVSPPRMSVWKKPIRGFFRLFRLSGIRLPQLPSIMPRWAMEFIFGSLFVAVFSIIPGLAHLLKRQFRTIFRYWIAWVALTAMTIFFWGGPLGMVCFGLTLAIHVWIAMQGGILKEFSELQGRMIAFVILALVYFFIYSHTGRFVLEIFDVRTGYSLVDTPGSNVQVGSFLLGRTRDFTLHRGDLVLTTLSEVYGRSRGRGRESEGFVQIVGLPGERLEIRNRLFFINGKSLDPQQYLVPQWLSKIDNCSAILSSDQYFIIAEFHGRGYNSSYVVSVCVLSAKNFQARAFLRWWPLRFRGFIESDK